ncbi:MAG: NAD(P)-dependent oxidoreductase [Candidatus Paceibacterota bacterium]|jgi:D-lactate dehydrogenase
MKLIYFYNEEWEKEYVAEKLQGQNISFYSGSIQKYSDLRDDDADALAVFVNSKIGAEEMDRFPKLRFIAARSTGFDNIDLEEAEKRNIFVSNVPTYGENTVAEFSFALLLALSRKIYTSYKNIEINHSFSTQGLTGFDLKDKTIGIVGTGHIGLNAIRIAKGFGMNIIAFDVFEKSEEASRLGFEYVAFDDLLARSDVISLYAPYNEHTHHMINRENIEKIKRGAWLINTARGGLVETDALVYALEKGIIAGAGLDVLEEEKNTGDETALLLGEHPMEEELKLVLANHYLIWHKNVIITPHNAFNTREAIMRILDTSVKNLNAFAVGNFENLIQ